MTVCWMRGMLTHIDPLQSDQPEHSAVNRANPQILSFFTVLSGPTQPGLASHLSHLHPSHRPTQHSCAALPETSDLVPVDDALCG